MAVVMLGAGPSYLVRTVTAVTAAYVLLHAARRHQDHLGRARRFFAAALCAGGLSGLASAAHLLATGRPAGTGFVGDWIYLCYAPLAVLGVLAVPRATGQRGETVRALADGAVAAGALWYLSLLLLIEPRGLGDNLEPAAKAITLAYPLLPAFVVAVILSALPRVARGGRPFLYRAAAGITLLGLSDAAFSVASWSSTYDPASWIAGANEVGLLLILDAACVRARSTGARVSAHSDADVDATRGLLVVGAPYAPLVLALGATVPELIAGRGMPHSQIGPVLLIGVAVLVRHVAGTRETSRLVSRIAARERVARTQARTDPLTGLANLTAFIELLAPLKDTCEASVVTLRGVSSIGGCGPVA